MIAFPALEKKRYKRLLKNLNSRRSQENLTSSAVMVPLPPFALDMLMAISIASASSACAPSAEAVVDGLGDAAVRQRTQRRAAASHHAGVGGVRPDHREDLSRKRLERRRQGEVAAAAVGVAAVVVSDGFVGIEANGFVEIGEGLVVFGDVCVHGVGGTSV